MKEAVEKKPNATHAMADVCLMLEGTYPYVPGGVSSWTHELLNKQSHLKFHIVAILPRNDNPKMHYQMPDNVISLTNINLQRLPAGEKLPESKTRELFEAMKQPMINLTTGTASLRDLVQMIEALAPYQQKIGERTLLNSETAWQVITDMYETSFGESSMLDYFWSWRAVMGGLCSLLLADLPPARCYHALSTGYAGLLAARAKLETRRPLILTEHGIYTNERRIEIASADWLEDISSKTMTIDRTRLSLRDMWIETFTNYSRICYDTCDDIITLYNGNRIAQIADGADDAKIRIIPNGIDVETYGSIIPEPQPRPTIALIGRVVPIKDIKNFIRAIAALRESVPDLQVFVMGPMDEDRDYVEECKVMVEYLRLGDTLTFTGKVNIKDHLSKIKVLVSSSISEAQPLVILEAGASGIPAVATDVGACREMITGKEDENPQLGPAGVVVPLANPQALAQAIFSLLSDKEFYQQCSNAMRTRVALYYNKNDQHSAYKELYAASCNKE
jgi:glycosyltransferase involved in cell wall biosynthesis